MATDADIIIIPGSKSTVSDLSYLREQGFVPLLDTHLTNQRELVGICGGYQMLGLKIADPDHVEQGGVCHGLGYLDVETTLEGTKRTTLVQARPTAEFMREVCLVRGYEIHMGVTQRVNEAPCFALLATHEERCDGTIRKDGLVWGTYIHGVFDESGFRRSWLNRARQRKRLPRLESDVSEIVSARFNNELDRWADHVAHHIDIPHLLNTLRPR